MVRIGPGAVGRGWAVYGRINELKIGWLDYNALALDGPVLTDRTEHGAKVDANGRADPTGFERAAANGLSNGRVLISRELRRSPFNRPGGRLD